MLMRKILIGSMMFMKLPFYLVLALRYFKTRNDKTK